MTAERKVSKLATLVFTAAAEGGLDAADLAHEVHMTVLCRAEGVDLADFRRQREARGSSAEKFDVFKHPCLLCPRRSTCSVPALSPGKTDPRSHPNCFYYASGGGKFEGGR